MDGVLQVEKWTDSACILIAKKTEFGGLDMHCDRNRGNKCDFNIWGLNNCKYKCDIYWMADFISLFNLILLLVPKFTCRN